jgi:lysozyme
MLTPSAKAIALIKKFEGCKPKAYLCPAKVPTFGFGATGPDVKLGMVWTQAKADARLACDVAKFAKGVAAIGPKATQAQFDALVSLAYNIGLGALKGSTLLKLHNAANYKAAAAEFSKWAQGGGVTLPGLVTRRKAEAALYIS